MYDPNEPAIELPKPITVDALIAYAKAIGEGHGDECKYLLLKSITDGLQGISYT